MLTRNNEKVKNKKIDKENLFLILKKIKNKKKVNIANLWRYDPATISTPNGPPNLLGSFDVKPKISLPKLNW